MRNPLISILLLLISLGGCTQETEIPDRRLSAAISEALGKNANAPITKAEFADMTALNAYRSGIIELTGLEHAINLAGRKMVILK